MSSSCLSLTFYVEQETNYLLTGINKTLQDTWTKIADLELILPAIVIQVMQTFFLCGCAHTNQTSYDKFQALYYHQSPIVPVLNCVLLRCS